MAGRRDGLPGGTRTEGATMAVAAYARIADDLRVRISSRDIRPGDPLPSELELRDHYQASRNTVLDAIRKLKDEGLVETRPGQGWYARVRIVPFVNSLDWSDSMAIEQAKERGRIPRVTPPVVSLQQAPTDIAGRLGVPAGTEMIIRRQDWFLDDLPWKLQVAWCPRALFDEGARQLLMAEDIDQGLGAYLASTLHQRPASMTFYFLPRQPTHEESEYFGFPAEGGASYVVELTRTAITSGEDGRRPLYTVVGVFAGDRNRFAGTSPFPQSGSRAATPSEMR
jgi:GntR family transcriptional regulator